MTVLTGLLIGLLFPILYVHAGRWWAVAYGAMFIAAVAVLDLVTGDLTATEGSYLLVAFAVAVALGWRLVGGRGAAAHRA